MLNEVWIKKATRDAMTKYYGEHGKKGISKSDVIEIILDMGGDADDVRAVMIEGAKIFGITLDRE